MSTTYRVLYRTADGKTLHQVGPEVMVAFPVAELHPVREVNNRHGQQHRIGWYVSRKAGRPLKFESMLERLRMMFLDFDPSVTTFAAQPFTLQWEGVKDGQSRLYGYTPDLLIVRPGQGRTVEDVKPEQFRNSKKNLPAFEAARDALPPVGLKFALWSPPSAVVTYNVRYLAGYRRTPLSTPSISRDLLAQLADGPLPLRTLAQETTGHEMLTRPVIYHLMWIHRLRADLTRPLSHATLIHRAEDQDAPPWGPW